VEEFRSWKDGIRAKAGEERRRLINRDGQLSVNQLAVIERSEDIRVKRKSAAAIEAAKGRVLYNIDITADDVVEEIDENTSADKSPPMSDAEEFTTSDRTNLLRTENDEDMPKK